MSDNQAQDDRKKEEENKVKSSAFVICFVRTFLSLLPAEAGALRYDPAALDFEGVALDFNPFLNKDVAHAGSMTVAGAREIANDLPGFLRNVRDEIGEEAWWYGYEFNFVRAHFVDELLCKSVSDDSQIQQIVVCGVGQDYRTMRYGKAIQQHGARVIELDLEPMMQLRQQVKARICELSPDVVLPETHELCIDFDQQHVSDALLACSGFDPQLATLYLWEGVTYYLTDAAVKSFLRDIGSLMRRAPPEVVPHHRLFLDHLIDLPRLVRDGDLPAKAMLDMFAESEPLESFIDFDQVESYLQEVGFCVHQELQPPDMYKPYQATANSDYHLTESKYFGMVVIKPVTDKNLDD